MASNGFMQLLGGLAGAAIGFVVSGGNPLGASLGFSLGAGLVAARIPGEDIKVGKISDKRVSGSSYGDTIWIVDGHMRVPARVVYVSDLNEKKDSKREGGGIFSKGTKVTTYSYRVDMCIMICEGEHADTGLGEIIGVKKIRMNSKLVYDVDAVPQIPEKVWDDINFYTGSQTQQPDPYLEEIFGVGNVHAMRGKAYMFIKGLNLTKRFNNSIPTTEIDVVASGTLLDPPQTLYALDETFTGREAAILDKGTMLGMSITKVDDDEYDLRYVRTDLYGNILDQTNYHLLFTDRTIISANMFEIQDEPRAAYFSSIQAPTHSRIIWNGVEIYQHDHVGQQYATQVYDYQMYGSDEMRTCKRKNPNGDDCYITTPTTTSAAKGLMRYEANGDGAPTFVVEASTTFTDAPGWTTTAANTPNYWLWPCAENEDEFYVICTQTPNNAYPHYITRMNTNFEVLAYWAKEDGCPVDNQMSGRNMLWGPGYILKKSVSTSNKADLWSFDHETARSTWTKDGSATIQNPDNFVGVAPVGNIGIMTKYDYVTRLPVIDEDAASLASVWTRHMRRAGYPASRLDSTGLTGTVDGHAVPGPSSTRTIVEQLQRAHFFDMVEIDGKITGVMRGSGSSLKTYTEGELAARIEGQQIPDLIPGERLSEQELPKRVTVTYVNAAMHFEAGAQTAGRQTVGGNKEEVIDLNMNLSDDRAMQIANVLLYEFYSGRNQFNVRVLEKDLRFVATDLITVPIEGDNQLVRINDKNHETGGVIEFLVAKEYLPIYTQAMQGAPTGETFEDVLDEEGPSRVELADLPLLDYSTDSYLAYIGALGYLSTWGGVEVWRYSLDTTAYSKVMSIVETATMGSATDALAAPDTPWQWDYTNTVNIRLSNTTLTLTSSTEAEVEVDRNINRFALGRNGRWELCQFVNATLETDGTYTLDTLLRGRSGTEPYTDSHLEGDSFILLDPAIIVALPFTDGDVNTELLFKFPNISESVDLVESKVLAYEGISKRPYAVAEVTIDLVGSDFEINWVPRTRLDSNLSALTDIDEDPEITEWTIDIMDGTTVKGTHTVTPDGSTWFFDYTLALQTIDWGSGNEPTDLVAVVYAKGTTAVGWGWGRDYDTANDTSTLWEPRTG